MSNLVLKVRDGVERTGFKVQPHQCPVQKDCHFTDLLATLRSLCPAHHCVVSRVELACAASSL